jgi:hypothetical protein
VKHLGWRTWTQWPGWTAAYLELSPGSLKLDVPDDVAAVLMPAIEKAVRDAEELRAVPLTCSDYEGEGQ